MLMPGVCLVSAHLRNTLCMSQAAAAGAVLRGNLQAAVPVLNAALSSAVCSEGQRDTSAPAEAALGHGGLLSSCLCLPEGRHALWLWHQEEHGTVCSAERG